MNEEELDEFVEKIQGLAKKMDRNCTQCKTFITDVRQWMGELESLQIKMSNLAEHYDNKAILRNKRINFEKREFEAVDNLDQIIEDFEEHLDGHAGS